MPNKRSINPMAPAKFWVSVDPATKSGVAIWRGDELFKVDRLRPVGNSGKYVREDNESGIKYDSRIEAWKDLSDIAQYGIVVERGAGRFAAAIRSQGKICGYIEACCDLYGRPYVEVVVSEWRRVMKEDHGVSFPKDSKRCKALSRKLVKELYGLDVTDDESDAILLGRAAMRMRLLPWM